MSRQRLRADAGRRILIAEHDTDRDRRVSRGRYRYRKPPAEVFRRPDQPRDRLRGKARGQVGLQIVGCLFAGEVGGKPHLPRFLRGATRLTIEHKQPLQGLANRQQGARAWRCVVQDHRLWHIQLNRLAPVALHGRDDMRRGSRQRVGDGRIDPLLEPDERHHHRPQQDADGDHRRPKSLKLHGPGQAQQHPPS